MSILKKFIICLFSIFLTVGIFSGCGNKDLGYSVVLWSSDEHGIVDGDILRVIIRSNITKTYTVQKLDSTSNEDFFDIPLWQITEPVSLRQAKKKAQQYVECAHKFASVKIAGLPIRSEPVNTSKQLYRLRDREVIRVLYKGEGAAVSGIEGDWYKVLTKDGTSGWCFSYNLDLFDGSTAENPVFVVEGEAPQNEDDVLELLASKKWYPSYYSEMVKNHTIDLARMDKSYGFNLDKENSKVALAFYDIEEQEVRKREWTYTGFMKVSRNRFMFEGTNLQIFLKDDSTLSAQFSDNSGITQSCEMASLTDDIESVISGEKNRRASILNGLTGSGPYSSASYGTLSFNGNNFSWSDYDILVPNPIDEGLSGNGTVSIKYLLNPSLQAQFAAIVTFNFYGGSPVNFYYKKTGEGIRLEYAQSQIEDNVVKMKGVSSYEMNFTR